MRAVPLILLPCAFLVFHGSAAAEEPLTPERRLQIQAACPGSMPVLDRIRCRHMELAAGSPCVGTVEKRLICLEDRISKQARQIMWLKYELDKFERARVQPLEGDRLSQN